MASLTSNTRETEPIHLPIMSRLSEGDKAERHGHDVAGDVLTSQPKQSADRAGKGGDQKELYPWRKCYAQGQTGEREP